MKKWYALLLIGILMFTGCKKGNVDSPSNGSTELEFSLTATKKSYYVTGIGECKDYDIVIPSSYNGLPVIGIGEKAFYRNEDIRSINVSNGIKLIEKQAFYDCGSLTIVIIPGSVSIIGEEAFYDCDYLTKIKISNGVRSIENRAFAHCDSLTSLYIPKSVTKIGIDAFSYAESVIFFCEAKNKTSGWNIKWRNLDSYIYWGINNYLEQDGLIYIVKDGNAIVAGRQSNNIKDFVISSTITIRKKNYKVIKIGEYAFSDHYYLESVKIPDSVTAIGKYAFKNCRLLSSIFIPNSVAIIEDYAFSDCSCLSMFFEANFTPGNWNKWSDSSRQIYC